MQQQTLITEKLTKKIVYEFTIHRRLPLTMRNTYSNCSITASLTPILEKPPSWNKF
jgi:hypothetical protein